MAKFLHLYAASDESFYLNLEMIEQVNPHLNTVWMTSGEEYRIIDDGEFSRLMSYVEKNLVK